MRNKNGVDPEKYNSVKESKRKELFNKELKKCSKCKEIKGLCEFSNGKNKDGRRSICKSCESDQQRERNNTDPKNYRLTRKEKQELDKQKLQRCGSCMEIKSFDGFNNSKTTKNSKSNQCRSCRNKYRKEKRKNDPIYKLDINIRGLIHSSLKRKGYTKKSRTHEILGCSYEDFKSHIESKFEPWMTWENQGLCNGTENYGWDLDHIVPISSATTEEEVLKLNHYTNFQPLCSHINRVVKRDRLDY